MTVDHLSQAWLDRYVELAADLPERPGASARLQVDVPKTPDGDVAYALAFEDGRLVEAHTGADEKAAITFTTTYADAQAIARAELDVVVGFMRGQVKMAGSTATLLAVQPVLQSAEHRAVLAALAADTKV